MKPKITVLIPTFNRRHFLAECLDSILSQTYAPSQILVVDNGSTDHTTDALRPYGKAIECFKTPQSGKSVAINAGLLRVTGDYLWIFDDDDVAVSDALERLAEPLERHPEHGFSYGNYYFTANRPEDNRLGAILGEAGIPELREQGFLIPLLEANFLGGASLLARTSCYACVGDFDVRLIRSQDYEMAIRIARRFSGIRAAGGPLFHARQHNGLRGSTRGRFSADMRLRRWLEYDQVIFRRLYREIPLAEYLPPGLCLDGHIRQAHLQRLAIMATKLLVPEAILELNALRSLADDSPWSERERAIIRSVVNRVPFYQQGSLRDSAAFLDELRRLARTSSTIRMLRSEILDTLCAGIRESRWRRPKRTVRTVQSMLRLYLPGLQGRSCGASPLEAKP